MLEYGILGFLKMKPLTGYELKKLFDTSVGYFWWAEQSQIYITLKKMAKEGLVEIIRTEPSRVLDKKIYALTPAGTEMLQAWLESDIVDSNIKSAPALKCFFLGEGDPQKGIEVINNYIENQKKVLNLYENLEQKNGGEYRRFLNLDEDSKEYRINAFAVRWGIKRTEAQIEYLMEFKEELKSFIKD
jgi:DNA-binding PadR family transcriptional regulator